MECTQTFAPIFRNGSLLLVFCLSFAFVHAQDEPDPLRDLVNKAVLLSQSGRTMEAEKLYAQADSLARIERDSVVVVAANFGLVNHHIDEPVFLDSLLDLVYLYFPSDLPYRYRIEYHLDRAHVADIRNEYERQILHVDSALIIARRVDDTINVAYAYFELSVAYQNVANYASAVKMAHNAEGFFNLMKEVYSEAFAIRSGAVALNGMGQWEESNKELERSNALFLSQNADYQVAYNLGVMGNNYLELKNYKLAETNLIQAKEIMESDLRVGFEGGYPQVLAWLGMLYHRTDRPKMAWETTHRAYVVSDSMELEGDKLTALEGLIRIRLATTDSGESYLEEYLTSMESQYEAQKSRAVLEFENKYKAEERERKILELDKAAQKAEIRAQNSRLLIFGIISGFSLLILVALVLYLRARYRTRMKINELNRKALQLQINPHFFFNVLNSINQYIAENDQKSARYYLVKFAKLMRLSLENSQFDLVPLGQEADLVEAYLYLEKLRNDNFDFEIKIPGALRELHIPPLMIQPFVENAVVHAFPEDMEGKGEITLEAGQDGSYLELVVSDNGIGVHEKKKPESEMVEGKTSLAIGILEKRLSAYGKRKGGIRYAKLKNDGSNFPGTRVFIRIPLSS